jgi:hypothetical protein
VTAPRRRRRGRIALAILAAGLALALGLWIAIHRVRWLGPMLADGARSVLGPDVVAWVEATAYDADDWVQRTFRGDERPEAYWDVPAPSAAPTDAPAPIASSDVVVDAGPPPFRPADVGPIYQDLAAPGDGTWVPIPDARRPEAPPLLHKTLLHPDRVRAWSAVSIVAVDLTHVDLQLVAGTREPESLEKAAIAHPRTGLVPPERLDALLAVFNGGFKAIHGKYGMRIDGVTLVKPRKDACTVALFDDGSLAIRTWTTIAEREGATRWWRQTPACMFERGEMHVGLTVEKNTYWGAKLGGDTVIRRSAIGLDDAGRVLFVGIGEAMTAPSIAKALRHAGAADVAELDVNWSFPRLLLFEPREPGAVDLVAKPLCKGFDYTEDEYVREPSTRDFFYLARRDEAPVVAR